MARKIFYFVRHGESILNQKGIRQGSEGALSDKGRLQAEQTGQRFKGRTIDIILVSPYERTKETAAIINKYVNKNIEYCDLLKERRNPSEIVGKLADSEEVTKIVDIIDRSFHADDYRYSDEENFLDLKNRAKALLDYLALRKEKNILVVTHGIFLKMVGAYLVEGEALTASAYNKLSFLNSSSNASITVCEYKTGWYIPSKDKGWKLIAWDDYAIGAKELKSKPI